MNDRLISSRDNAQFKRCKALYEGVRGSRREAVAVLDGVHLLGACLDAGITPNTLLLGAMAQDNAQVQQLLTRLPQVPQIRFSSALFRALCDMPAPLGIAALIDIPAPPAAAPPLCTDAIVLDAVQDAGNVGSMLRSAVAAGVRHAVLGNGCASAWSVKVLRAAQGAHFALSIRERVDLPTWLAGQGVRAVGTQLDAPQALYDADLRSPCLWVFGSEGSGLSAATRTALAERVRIPMAAGIESLNVGAAAAICLFEMSRQRRARINAPQAGATKK